MRCFKKIINVKPVKILRWLILVVFPHHKFLKTGLDLTDGQVTNFLMFIQTLQKSANYYVYWNVHHLGSWIKIDQLDVTCFIISLFNAQRVSDVNTSIFRSLRLIVDLFHVLYCSGSMCVGVTVWFGWGGVVSGCRLKQRFSLYKD